MSSSLVAAAAVSSLLSHGFETDLETHRARIQDAPHLTLSAQETVGLLEELSTFELGRFFIENQGLNGRWTSYLILDAPQRDDLSDLESWITHRAPAVIATRARFHIFQDIMTARLKDHMRIASVPCGIMEDLLRLPIAGHKDITFAGIDLDQEGLLLAAQNAQKHGATNVSFHHKDAWNLGEENAFDLLTSNGLNIYEPDPARRAALFGSYFKALKQGGTLVSSFLTPPPILNPDSPWTGVVQEDAIKQKAIFVDVIGAKWQNFDMPDAVIAQLSAIGFQDIQILPDPNWVMPTVVATKP